MPQVKTWLKTDLSKQIPVIAIDGEMFNFDNQGNVIGVEVYDNGEPVTLTGDIIGYVIRADGTTVYIEGEIDSVKTNRATITLPAVAYAIIGGVTIVIRCINGDQKTVIGACRSHVTRSRTDEIVDPGEIIPGIEDLPVIITDVTTYYQASDSGSDIPTGEWSETIPTVNPGQYLWIKQVLTWNTSQTTDIYTLTKFGQDGSGTVGAISMNGQTYNPGVDGVVNLGAVGIVDDNAGSSSKMVWSIDKNASVYAVKSKTASVTAAAGSWSSSFPSTQTLTVQGVTSSNLIIVGLASDATSDQIEAAGNAAIRCTAQGANSITLTAYGSTPNENLPVSVVILG